MVAAGADAGRGGPVEGPLFDGLVGVDVDLGGFGVLVIALWLGHESLSSTQAYLHADMHQKQEAIGKTAPPGSKQKRYRPPDKLLEFLENL